MIRFDWRHAVGLMAGMLLFLQPAAQAGCYSYYPSYDYGYGYPTYYQPYYPPKIVERVVLDYYPVYQVGYLPAAAVTTTTTQTVETASVQQASAAFATQAVQRGGAVQKTTVVPSACEQKLQELTAKYEALEGRLNAAIGAPEKPPLKGTAPPMEPVTERPRTSAIVQHCGSCHDVAVAATKGGKLVLATDGKPLRLDDKQTGQCMRVLATGEMPKGHKLSDQDLSLVVSELLAMHAKK